MLNVKISTYIFYTKISIKKIKSYFNIYRKAFKSCFWSIFGNFQRYSKKAKSLQKKPFFKTVQPEKVKIQLNKFFSFFEFQLDQILFKVGFFSKMCIIRQLIVFGCVFINGAPSKKNSHLITNDVFCLSLSAFNLVRKLFFLKKLILINYAIVKQFYSRSYKTFGLYNMLLPSKTFYSYLIVNYKYYMGIFISPLQHIKPLLFNRFYSLDLNNFYLALKK